MANYAYNPAEYTPSSFEIPEEGPHRVRIADVKEKQSSRGNSMYEITLEMPDSKAMLWYYLVLMPDNHAATTKRLGDFFDCFSIPAEYQKIVDGIEIAWIGRIGAVQIVHEEYNGTTRAKVKYLISQNRQSSIPPWPGGDAATQYTYANDMETPF